MYKVFIQNKPLFFIKNKKNVNSSGVFISETLVKPENELLINFLVINSNHMPVYILSEDPKKTFEKFFSNYVKIIAAGGVVRRKDKYLFIKRNGVWDLPKGKVDEGEKIKHAALREIEEECGIFKMKLHKIICKTYHVYEMNQQNILKETHWFDVSYAGSKEVYPQIEEGITKVKWFHENEIKKIYKNTYPSILDVVKQYFRG